MVPDSRSSSLASRQLGSLRKIDDHFRKDDLSVKTSFSQSAKKESTSKVNYYCNSLACFQLQRHAISGDIHPNPGPVLRHNSRQENKPTRKPKLSCWSLNARSMANKGRELISWLTYKPCNLVAITETWLYQSIERAPKSDIYSLLSGPPTRSHSGILFACNIELGCVRRLDFETDCEILW